MGSLDYSDDGVPVRFGEEYRLDMYRERKPRKGVVGRKGWEPFGSTRTTYTSPSPSSRIRKTKKYMKLKTEKESPMILELWDGSV